MEAPVRFAGDPDAFRQDGCHPVILSFDDSAMRSKISFPPPVIPHLTHPAAMKQKPGLRLLTFSAWT
jgi:hypothetical protein